MIDDVDAERATLQRARSLRAEATYQIARIDKILGNRRRAACTYCGGTPPRCCQRAWSTR